MAKSKNQKGKKDNSFVILMISLAVIAVIVLIAFVACDSSKNTADTAQSSVSSSQDSSSSDTSTTYKTYSDDEIPSNNTKIKFTMTDGKSFVVETYSDYAPQTVANFAKLVKDGFYNGLTFHRVVDGFMAQGGDPEGTGMGGSPDTIFGEFSSNGFSQNTLSHQRGVISMARSQDPNSASSQFFICYDDASFLDGEYAAFGKIVEGMDTIDGFLNVERSMNSMGEEAIPQTPIVIEKAEILE